MKCTCIGAGLNANISFFPSPEYPSILIKMCIPSLYIMSAALPLQGISKIQLSFY